ncbi:MAG: hypothetical protein AMXMBFR7_12180 [Planctomycetota bacterium]
MFSRLLGVGVDYGVVNGTVIVFFYATLGGMKGITWTQVSQYVVLIFAFLIPAFAISHQLTGNPIPQLGFGSTLVDGPHAGETLLRALDQINTDLGLPEYTAAFVKGKKSMIDVFAIAFALMVGTAGLPHVIIRFYTVPTVRAARWSAFWALLFIGALYTTAPAVGAFARVNLIQTLHGQPYETRPEWVKKWEETGLIVFKDTNGNGLIDGVVRSTETDPAKEMKVDVDIMVLANPEIAKLPPWVVALVAAGGLAAALSTAAGLLLVISSAISHDLMKRVVKPNMTEVEELFFARIAAGLAVIAAGLLGIFPPGFVGQVVAFAFGLAASSFFPVIVLGIFSKRTTKEGAIAGMLSGIGFTTAYIVYFKFIVDQQYNNADHWLLGISPEGIGTVGMLVNFAVTLAVTAFTPPPPQDVQETVEMIRYPREEQHPEKAAGI